MVSQGKTLLTTLHIIHDDSVNRCDCEAVAGSTLSIYQSITPFHGILNKESGDRVAHKFNYETGIYGTTTITTIPSLLSPPSQTDLSMRVGGPASPTDGPVDSATRISRN